MSTRIKAAGVGALAAIATSVAIPALTGAQASSAGSAQAAHARLGVSQANQIPAIERARVHALVDADTATARRMMASDFQAVTPSGDTLSLHDYLGSVAAGVIDYRVFKPVSRVVVRSYGDAAAIRYKVSFDLVAGGTKGVHVVHKGWITELWERHAGRWLLVWEHATAIPNNFGLFIQSIEPPKHS